MKNYDPKDFVGKKVIITYKEIFFGEIGIIADLEENDSAFKRAGYSHKIKIENRKYNCLYISLLRPEYSWKPFKKNIG